MTEPVVEIPVYPEDLAVFRRALRALKGERTVLERWNEQSVELSVAIGGLELIIARVEHSQRRVSDDARGPLLRLIGSGSVKPW